METKYDVIVVGAGNAALCSAIAAQEQGSSVLVIERAPKEKKGGNSFFTDGAIRAAYNDLENIRTVVKDLSEEEAVNTVMPTYTEDDFYEDLMRVTKNESDPELASTLVAESFKTIQWMNEHGVEFELNKGNQSFVEKGKRIFWGGLPLKTKEKGIGLMRTLFRRAEELGIHIIYNSRATEILLDQERVCGLKAVIEGENKIFTCKSIILACGSFEANKEMRKNNIGEEWEAAIVRGTEYNTGDGIDMALRVGARRFGQWDGCHAIGTDANAPKSGDFNKPGDIFKKHSYPLSIMVNKDGQRFVDEGADFRNYTYAKYGKEVLRQPDHIAFQIFDSKVRPLLREEYNLEEATVYKAATIEELAEQLPIASEAFLSTINYYNAAVQEGDFNPSIKDGKHTEGIMPPKTNWANTIDKGPFYAYPVTCGITFAFGGVHVDPEGHVLNENEQPIPGLYAAGEMVGGIFYHNYPGGSGLMSGSVYGKIAGTSAGIFSSMG
ncbi:FAD-dependent tricarballylate dehydrogenase TcuA [Edaphobacillus lindanitolerans]|uniref:Tricarballylate dehydrogenase n=1 Tax=Edaphobacillus lindanitolerans TaxID=550447 RepID=A0A1U7PMR7_9BACI|nr:FAD-dependent tricarballylate dehydrogenase TcuA [Edaphobacillus lindanitolerans]SIT72490.1 tricarballylate dehydrogenase [Edaphobacillus lindanitolerans]